MEYRLGRNFLFFGITESDKPLSRRTWPSTAWPSKPVTEMQYGRLELETESLYYLAEAKVCQNSEYVQIPNPPGPVQLHKNHWNTLQLNPVEQLWKDLQQRKIIDPVKMIHGRYQSVHCKSLRLPPRQAPTLPPNHLEVKTKCPIRYLFQTGTLWSLVGSSPPTKGILKKSRVETTGGGKSHGKGRGKQKRTYEKGNRTKGAKTNIID